MKSKLKLALLEDSKIILKDLSNSIEENKLGEVIIMATSSEDFIDQIENTNPKPDALVLDIDFSGDSMNGLDIANMFDLPVFFITGKTKEFLEHIETLKYGKDVPIEFMTKPIIPERLIKLFRKFEKSIEAFKKAEYLEIKGIIEGVQEIEQDKIICIKSILNSESNNKEIQLSDIEVPLIVSHKSLKYFFDNGLSSEKFIQTSQSCIVNKAYLKSKEILRCSKEYTLRFKVNGIEKTEKIEITDMYWSKIKKQRK